MKFDMAIVGGNVALPGRDPAPMTVAVTSEKIAAILSPGEAVEATQTIDAAGLVVLPGVLDVHLHLGHGKDISRPREQKDAAQETAAAAVGGVTTFIPYLMASEPFEADLRRRARCHRERCTDRLRLSLYYLDRAATGRRSRLRVQIWRTFVQDIHEQPWRRRKAAGSA